MKGTGVVPLKALSRAKTRLVLASGARTAIAAYMARHVIECLVRCSRIERVVAIVGDDDAAALARGCGATPVGEHGDNLGAMIDAVLGGLSAPWAVVAMADLPWLTGADIDDVIALLATHPAVIACDEDGAGTNALGVRIPVGWTTAFGTGHSFAAHLDRAGPDAAILRSPTIAFDVDLPAHLKRAARCDSKFAAALGGTGGQ